MSLNIHAYIDSDKRSSLNKEQYIELKNKTRNQNEFSAFRLGLIVNLNDKSWRYIHEPWFVDKNNIFMQVTQALLIWPSQYSVRRMECMLLAIVYYLCNS